MKALIFVVALLPSLGFATVKQVTDYKTASCTLYKGEVKLEERKDITLMLLSIEDHLGKFTQLAFADGSTKIQYQLLIEDDESSKTLDAFLALQNLKVDKKEISAEFAAKEIKWATINDGTYKVSCTLAPAPVAAADLKAVAPVADAPKVDSATHD